MAIHGLGRKAKSLTGWQAGFRTESVHGKARITDIMPERVFKALDEGISSLWRDSGNVGRRRDYNAWTRGSDTTAVALAAPFKRMYVKIYTDVDGIYSTDRGLSNVRGS